MFSKKMLIISAFLMTTFAGAFLLSPAKNTGSTAFGQESVETTEVSSAFYNKTVTQTYVNNKKAEGWRRASIRSGNIFNREVILKGPMARPLLKAPEYKGAKKFIRIRLVSPETTTTTVTLSTVEYTNLCSKLQKSAKRYRAYKRLTLRWNSEKRKFLAKFDNKGQAHLTSYNDGTRTFGDIAGDSYNRGKVVWMGNGHGGGVQFYIVDVKVSRSKFIALKQKLEWPEQIKAWKRKYGIKTNLFGFFYDSDVGGAVHGSARADIYTPWSSEPCEGALGVYF